VKTELTHFVFYIHTLRNMRMTFLVILFLFSSYAYPCTGDFYSIPAGAHQDINECGTCKLVTNNGASRIFVPTKTNAEWTAFYTNVNANTGGNVVIGVCGGCNYPLDTVTAPSAAYSLRKVRTAYAGPLIRVRRSSDNTELDISPAAAGCGLLDTAALTAFTGAGNGFVKTWYDQSGNGRHAVQGTNASQPRIVNAGTVESKFGITTIFFNGTTFIPGVDLGVAATSDWSYSMVVGSTTVVSGAGGDGAGTYYLDRTTATNNLTGLKDGGGKLMLQKRTDAGGALGGISTTTNISTTVVQALFAERTYNTSYNVFLNNTGEGSLAETDGALTPPIPNIGRHTSTTTASNFGIYEFIFWGSALSSGDRTTVYFDQKNGFGF
jgi:hypothetical protein